MKNQVQVLIGAQWGDEGKGRIVDALAGTVGVVVRFQGGANAGHTVVVGEEKHIFHLLPCGMLYPGCVCIIGNGVVVDPEKLQEELAELGQNPKNRGARLVVSYAAHIVMPYHKRLDALAEGARSRSSVGAPIGTTGRGIGPCYVDKHNRIGIRAEDLVDPVLLREKLLLNLEEKNALLENVYGEKKFAFDELYAQALSWGEFIKPYLGDAALEIDEAKRAGKGILFEGAQGTMLDIDHGTYPFVTSSSCVAGGASIGGTIGPGRIDRVIGVSKAYCTRVGEGPFPTEDFGPAGDMLRDRGSEFGATTGRPRRCGWLDLVALNYAVRLSGIDVIALTKLDVLSKLDEIKVCVAYNEEGRETDLYRNASAVAGRVTPIYRTFASWQEEISDCRSFDELPQAARDYVAFISEATGVPVGLIGVGPERDHTILVDF